MYKDQKRNGRGIYTYKKKMVYEGEYVNNKKDGQGTMTFNDGGKYTGEWKANARHGTGTYIYANGDSYTGEWKEGKKSGQGKYVFADNGSTLSGTWTANRCVSGVWGMSDKSKYVGRFANNIPAGQGMFVFANKNKQAGTFVDSQWNCDVFNEPHPLANPPKPTKATPFTWAQRTIGKCLITIDHFEGILQGDNKQRAAGVPNLRQCTKLPVWGGGQPTLKGIKKMMEAMDEEGSQKLVWVSLRDTPVVYVNDDSFTGARPQAISRPMTFPELPAEDLPKLDLVLAEKIEKEVRATGGLMSYWKLALADKEEDVKRVEIVAEVNEERKEDEDEAEAKKPGKLPVRDVASLFKEETGWCAQNEVDCQYSRMQIPNDTFPDLKTVDSILTLAREIQPGMALFFQDQAGFDRVTAAMVIASLVRSLYEEPEEPAEGSGGGEEEEKKEEEKEEDENENDDQPGDEDLDPEELEAKKQERKAAREARKAARKAEEKEDEVEVLPDYKNGEYACITELVRSLGSNGAKFKKDTDKVINRCASLHNHREIILSLKDSKAPDARSKAQNALERYFYYIMFYAYLKTNQETEFEPPFSKWMTLDKQQEVLGVLGTREAGALANFKWT